MNGVVRTVKPIDFSGKENSVVIFMRYKIIVIVIKPKST